jgi:hypothetical protein
MPPTPKTRSRRALANYVLRLLGPKRGGTNARIALSEFNISAYDDLTAIRCLRETYSDRLSDCHCAEFCGPDGTLIWEERVNADV